MPNMLSKLIKFGSKFIDYPKAIIAASIMASVVTYINYDHGWMAASVAGLKQFAYTFLFGGMIIKGLEKVVTTIQHKYIAIITATITCALVAVIAVFILHTLRGTPKPFESTVPTMILAPFGFLFLSFEKRKKWETDESMAWES